MWARGWGKLLCTCPCLVHTFRRTTPGPKDASPYHHRLAPEQRRRSPRGPFGKRGVGPARAGPPPGHGRLQLRYASGHTGEGLRLGPKRGAMQALSGVPNHPHGGMFAGHATATYTRKTPRGDTHRSLVLPRESHHLQPAARLPGREVALGHSMGSKRSSSPAEQAPTRTAAAKCATPRCGRTPRSDALGPAPDTAGPSRS